MKKVILIIISLIIISILSFLVIYKNLSIYDINFKSNIKFEINKEYKVSDLVDSYSNCSIFDYNKVLKFNKLGINKVKVMLKTRVGKTITKNVDVNVIDLEVPTASGIKNLSITAGDEIDLLKDVKAMDNISENVDIKIIGEYDKNKSGTYKLRYKISDNNGNSITYPFVLNVYPKVVLNNVSTYTKYYIKINKKENVVMIYILDKDHYVLDKTFICSAGWGTPVGRFYAGDRYDYLQMIGNVFARNTVRIKGDIFFHSVPYYTNGGYGNWDNLEYLEYNKLGNLASAGCVRLTYQDSRWIFDNIPVGTPIDIYYEDGLPDGVTKPKSIKVDVNNLELRGWDPTDPSKNNPYNR